MADLPRQAWDFDAFVRRYDEIARERGGWRWTHEIPPEKLREYYEGAPLFDDLRDFALTRYRLDQEL